MHRQARLATSLSEGGKDGPPRGYHDRDGTFRRVKVEHGGQQAQDRFAPTDGHDHGEIMR